MTDTKTAECTGAQPTIVQPEPKAQLPAVRPPLRGGGAIMPIIPQDIEQVWRVADMIARSGTAPKSYRMDSGRGAIDQSMVCVAIMCGLEVGVPPMQAIQGIAVINGIPTVYGDLRDGLVAASGLLEDMKEEMEKDDDGLFVWARCTIWRKGRKTPIVQTIDRPQAARARWLGKAGPWTENPNRMAQMRAKGWASRDAFPDVLKGLMDYDEAMDMVDVTSQGAATTEPQRRDYVPEAQPEQQPAETQADRPAEDPEGWPFYDETGEEVDKYTARGWLSAYDQVIGLLEVDDVRRAVAMENNRSTALQIARECVAEIGEETAAALKEHFTPATDVARESIVDLDGADPDTAAKHAAWQEQQAREQDGKNRLEGVGLEPDSSIVGQEAMAAALIKLIKDAPTERRVKDIQLFNAERMSKWTQGNRAKVAVAADDRIDDLRNPK